MQNSTIIKKELMAYISTFLNFIYPRNIYCILCDTSINREEKYSLCEKCREKLKFIKDKTCSKCGKPLDEEYLNEECVDCLNTNYYFTRAFSCIEYDEFAKKIVYDLKYHKKRYLSYHIAEIIIDTFNEGFEDTIDIIIPVPLHSKKERDRTFNQAYLISKYLGKSMEVPVDNKSLIRIKDTKTQNKLNREERNKNIKDAFEVLSDKNILGKNVLIIDDIYTTGSTVNEISRILIKSWAKNVYVMTFATGRNM